MLSDISLYIEGVVGHFVTILAGCGATVVLDLLRRFAKRKGWIKDDWPDLWWLYILIAFICFSSFQAWNDQHSLNVAGQGDLTKEKLRTQEKATAFEKESIRKEQCEEGKTLLGRIFDSQQLQLHSQQGTINTCFLELSKKLEPEPLRIESKFVSTSVRITSQSGPPGPPLPLGIVVSKTNKLITSELLTLHCEGSFEIMEAHLGTEATAVNRLASHVEQKSATEATMEMSHLSWDPEAPMVTLIRVKDGPGHCNVMVGR